MPAKYRHIHIAGSGPQLEIISVGLRTVMKLKIVTAHLWKGFLKRTIIRESVSGEQERHTQTLKKTSHLSHNKIKYTQHLFSLSDWHTDWAARKYFVAVLQDKSPHGMNTAPCLCLFLPTTAKADSHLLLDIDPINTVTSLH